MVMGSALSAIRASPLWSCLECIGIQVSLQSKSFVIKNTYYPYAADERMHLNLGLSGYFNMILTSAVLQFTLGSGPRYQILSHVFARCASQKTHGHARIARETRAIYMYIFCTCLKQILTNTNWRYSYVFMYVFLRTYSYVLLYVLLYVYFSLSGHILFVSARIPVRICTYPSPFLHVSRFVSARILVRIWSTPVQIFTYPFVSERIRVRMCLCPVCVCICNLVANSAKHRPSRPAKSPHIHTTTHAPTFTVPRFSYACA